MSGTEIIMILTRLVPLTARLARVWGNHVLRISAVNCFIVSGEGASTGW
jgi:hypothetical protein